MGTERRAVGRKAGLSVAGIVRASRGLTADELTVQAVADRMGVDRKAIRHHVTDRQTLLRLVALDALHASPLEIVIAEDSTWQDACRTYGTGLATSVIATGGLAPHLRVDASLFRHLARPTETLLQLLGRAGFDDELALRCLALLTNLCMAFAQDVVQLSETGLRPRQLMAAEALDSAEVHLPSLARLLTLGVDTYSHEQLELSIDVFVAGVDARRTRHEGAGRSRRR